MDSIIEQIENLIEGLLQSQPEYFLVSCKIKPTNNIKVFLDGDKGVTIEACVQLNRKLYKAIEEKAWYPQGDFSLEVSSPGVDEPLKNKRQYQKNVGRELAVEFVDGSKKNGKLIAVADEDFIIEITTGKGKKQEIHQEVIPFNNVKTSVVQIKF
jgi:ribosome maturation factor RimP